MVEREDTGGVAAIEDDELGETLGLKQLSASCIHDMDRTIPEEEWVQPALDITCEARLEMNTFQKLLLLHPNTGTWVADGVFHKGQGARCDFPNCSNSEADDMENILNVFLKGVLRGVCTGAEGPVSRQEQDYGGEVEMALVQRRLRDQESACTKLKSMHIDDFHVECG